MDQYIGRLLDNRYEILEVIGTGGMAVVYKARCHRLNRLVAIKILKDEFARDEEFRRRFQAEGEAVAMLSNPNVVQVYDVSSSDNANFIVMELIDGISLKQYMEKKGILNWKETLHFGMQIAKGLEHAHSRGIVHRDIKPHNVMVLKNGSVKVMDFGIARVMSKSNTLTKEALGSVHYISPEQAKGGHTDSRSDLYSLSVVMYEMMAGRPPYDGESPVAVAIQHINGGAPMPSTLNPNIPGGLEQIIMKGMALELRDRYPSATAMLQDMEEFRKNPAILFQHHRLVDDATRPITVVSGSFTKPTTAERVEQSKTSRPRTKAAVDRTAARGAGAAGAAASERRRSSAAASSAGAGRAVQQRRREQQAREEEDRSKTATIAVVICSAVAVIAIIVFLIALMNGHLLNQDQERVDVPYLVGKTYSEDMEAMYSDFVIRLQPQKYDDTYAKGQIIEQTPAGGDRVFPGTEIWITVSMGEEPPVKMMEDLVGLSQEVAKTFLDGQGFVTLVWEESSEEVEAGKVIRTDPAAGTELADGQTVKLYISTGPQIQVERMPDVVGMTQQEAEKTLNNLGFVNVVPKPVQSNLPKGQVVSQSETKYLEIDVTTQIVLEISEGPMETEPPETTEETTEPTETTESTESTEATTTPVETESQMNTVVATFSLPQREEAYILSIFLNGQEVTEAQQINPGTTSVSMSLTGSGIQVYDLWINGEYYTSQEVNFS